MAGLGLFGILAQSKALGGTGVYTMRQKTIPLILFFFLIHFAILSAEAASEDTTASNWHARNLPFRVLNTTSIGPSLWICGTDESLAVSSDAGEH